MGNTIAFFIYSGHTVVTVYIEYMENNIDYTLLETNRGINSKAREVVHDYFTNGMHMGQISEKYGCAMSCVSTLFKKLNITARPRSTGRNYKQLLTKEQMKYMYEIERKSTVEIAKISDTSPSMISYHLGTVGAMIRSSKESHTIYRVNEAYFDNIDNIDKAYWLGYLMADGYNNEKNPSVGIVSKDLDTVIAFKKSINTEAPIKYITNTYASGNSHTYARITVYNPHMSQALAKHGCIQAKTFRTTFLKDKEELIPAFMLGYFDADGSIWMSKSSNCIDVAGTLDFLKAYQAEFIKSCKFNDVGLKAFKSIYVLRYGGIRNLLKVYRFFYKNIYGCPSYFLKRKHDRFVSYIGEKINLCPFNVEWPKKLKYVNEYPQIDTRAKFVPFNSTPYMDMAGHQGCDSAIYIDPNPTLPSTQPSAMI